MIGKLRGTVDEVLDGAVVIDVNGVGYLVSCSSATLAALPAAGEPATLSIETVVREDMIRLFGFASSVERDWFNLLQTVQGVGAKVALAIQSTLAPGELAAALLNEDKAAISRATGVGPRLAQRILAELKGKVPDSLAAIPAAAAVPASPAMADAAGALAGLGYKPAQIHTALAEAQRQAGPDAKTDQLLRLALRLFAARAA
jgi:Holliday junction DNA helicase RuvA